MIDVSIVEDKSFHDPAGYLKSRRDFMKRKINRLACPKLKSSLIYFHLACFAQQNAVYAFLRRRNFHVYLRNFESLPHGERIFK